MDETIIADKEEKAPEIRLTARSTPENWEDLAEYIRQDTVLTDTQKNQYFDHHDKHKPDAREQLLKNFAWYPYMKKDIYPKLRTVKFNFYLHRKGMVKDTIHTTIVDSTYTKGVMALKDMDYDAAISLLAPYNDYNTAVAYIGKDRNLSALLILEPLEKTAPVNYLLAIIYSRIGEVQKAVQCYMESVEQDPSYRHRGNLDPEISVLIKQYDLFKEEEEIIYW
jgi:tetratricopeptide (TPR) repeat protein